MKSQYIKLTFLTIMITALITKNVAFASERDHNEPNNIIWVVALEKGFPKDEYWDPTLYKIGIESANIIEKKKLANSGAPVFCWSLPGNKIKAVIQEGIASNGTFVGEEITIDLIIAKDSMRILESKTKKGYNDYQEYRKIVLLNKNKELNTYMPKGLSKKEGDVFLGTSKITPRAFMLKNFLINKRDLSLQMLDSNTLKPTESIPINVGNRKLGGFFGVAWGDAMLILDRYVICLFDGNSTLGKFAPGYVMIVDTELKKVKYVAIGSDPARGIAY